MLKAGMHLKKDISTSDLEKLAKELSGITRKHHLDRMYMYGFLAALSFLSCEKTDDLYGASIEEYIPNAMMHAFSNELELLQLRVLKESLGCGQDD